MPGHGEKETRLISVIDVNRFDCSIKLRALCDLAIDLMERFRLKLNIYMYLGRDVKNKTSREAINKVSRPWALN